MNKTILIGALLFALVGVGVVVYSAGMFAPSSTVVADNPSVPTTTGSNQPVATTVTAQDNTAATPSAPAAQATVPAQTTTPAPTTNTGITMAQVAKHSTASDCWLVVDAKVYNVSSFENQHPGGAQAIIKECGKDASAVFASIRQHSRPGVDQEMQSLLIGNVSK